MHSGQQKLRSSATSERSCQQSIAAKTNPAFPFPHCEDDPYVVVAVSQELWFTVKQARLLNSPVTPSRDDTHAHAHSFLLLHEVICKVCKTGTICVILREVPFLCDILKRTQHIYMISHSVIKGRVKVLQQSQNSGQDSSGDHTAMWITLLCLATPFLKNPAYFYEETR